MTATEHRPEMASTGLEAAAGRVTSVAPGLATALIGSLLWASAMGSSAFAGLLLRGWQTTGSIAVVSGMFAAGAALAFPLAFTISGLVGGRRSQQRFAAAMLAFTLVTIGVTAAIFALQYRAYYAHWHGPAFSRLWANQFVFTMGSAVVQFLVSGVRLYFPIGFVALLAVSAWFARRRD